MGEGDPYPRLHERLRQDGETATAGPGSPYVVRTEDGLIVKRAGRDPSGAWQLISDHPDKRAGPNRPWPPEAEIIGEVEWAARTFL